MSGTSISLFKKRLRADSEPFTFKVRIPDADSENSTGASEKYYIFDTNVFVDFPDILDLIRDGEKVVLPITIEQELEWRRNDLNTKYTAERALEQLIKHKDMITYDESDLSVLPEDFFKHFSNTSSSNNDVNDNKILSIALKYKLNGKSITLVSSDGALTNLKSTFVGVRAISPEDFQSHVAGSESALWKDMSLTGTEASAMLLSYLRSEAEKALKGKVNKAVITVPATFNLVEIENTKKAGYIAGFKNVHIEKEPTAAAIAYNIDVKKDATTFIYDFGGGTFDVSIIQSDGKGEFNICATAGNSKLGGEDLTRGVEEYIYDYLEDNYDMTMYSQEDSGLSAEHFAYNLKTIHRCLI